MNCLVLWCKNKGKIPGINYFCLTKQRHDSWMRALGRDPTVEHLSEKNVICSKHFSEEAIHREGKRIHLRPNAVPTLFLRKDDICKQGSFPQEVNQNRPSTSKQDFPQKMSFESDDLEVLFVENKENIPGVTISCTPTFEIAASSPISLTTSSTDSPASLKRQREDTSTDSEGNKGERKRARREIQIRHNYSASPTKLLRQLREANVRKSVAQKKLKMMKVKVQRLKKKVTSLKQVIWNVKKKNLLSENGIQFLEKSLTGVPLSILRRSIEVRKKKNQGKQYKHVFGDDIKMFAMTLQFLSSKAYLYVRNTFDLALPAPSTIRKWLSKVNCEPGFCENSFNSLRIIVAENQNQNKDTLCSLMLDEMAIKKQIELREMKTWGYEDYGTGVTNDSLRCATEALVLMVVSLQGNWKLPIAYFLIHSMTGSEKANIVKEALKKLHEVGVKIVSITCDGPSAHITMAEKLGGTIRDLSNLQTYFKHPITNDKVFIIFDACHMLKLVRNNWASCGIFLNSKGEKIDFRFITKLHDVQEEELCRFGNKIGPNHINWASQKMKVNLAAQTLSASVASGLEFLSKDIKHPKFSGVGPTIEFIRIVDRLFDLLNSRNPFAKGYKSAMKKSNESSWRPFLIEAFTYLKSLRHVDGTYLHVSKNMTPILGFCTTIHSVLGIYDEHVKQENAQLQYLLTYKFSQDHLELFFCAVRGRNGWNNNPTAYQFYYTFRRLCLKIDLKVLKGNCDILDNTKMLSSINAAEKQNISPELGLGDIAIIKKYGIDYNDLVIEDDEFLYIVDDLPNLSLLNENVVTYISGYVVRSVIKQIKCPVCQDSLEESNYDSMTLKQYMLLHRKNRGGLVKSSKDVIEICMYTERKIRQVLNITDNLMPTEKHFLETFIMQASMYLFQEKNIFQCLENHNFDISPYELNHKMKLIRLIVRIYSKIRFFKIAKRQTDLIRGELKRKKFSKLILFHNQ